jgi:hypothetical protein
MLNSYEIINFKHHKIYKIKIDGVDNSKLLEDINIDRKFLVGDILFNPKEAQAPGIQFSTNLSNSESIFEIKNKCYNIVKEIYTSISNKKVVSGYQNCWVFISTPSNPDSVHHQHSKFSSELPKLTTSFTWTYYVDVPGNCEGNEGKLIFLNEREDDEQTNSIMIMPEAGYLYVFGGTLWHRPEISPNATNDRIVLAANVLFNTKSDSSNLI